ncbi:MAG: hypothetical protein DBX39_01120, partial [Bacillota bacterium]
MKKITKMTCENGLKLLIFLAVSFFVLILLSVFKVYSIKAGSWYLLAILSAIAIVQWAVIIFVLNARSDESGEYYDMDARLWIFTFIPTMAMLFATIVMYAALHQKFAFFALDFVNFIVAFAIFVLCVGFCYLLNY